MYNKLSCFSLVYSNEIIFHCHVFTCNSDSDAQFPYLTCVPASTDASGRSFKDNKDAATSHGGIILYVDFG